MKVRQAVTESLRLLDRRDRKRLFLVTTIQMATSLLDLIGVLLLGIVGALAVTTIQDQSPPPAVEQTIQSLGLEGLSADRLLAALAISAAAVLLAKSIFSSILLRRVFLFLASRQAVVTGRLTQALLAQPLTFVQRRSSQETAYSLVQGAGAATLVILGQAVVAVAELALLLVLSLTLLLISPIIAIASIIFFLLVAIALQYALGSWAARSGRVMAEADIQSFDAIQEVVNAYREVLVSDRRSLYVARVYALRWKAAKGAADLQFVSTFPKYVFEVAMVIGGFALAAVLFATQDAAEAVGTLTLFLAAATRVMPSILRLQGASLTMRNAAGVAASTFDLACSLGNSPDDLETKASTPEELRVAIPRYAEFQPSIDVRDVSFSYDEDTPAIQGVSLNVDPGTSLALVGRSGAGKSTLADLILGLLEPETGFVRLGGVPPSEAIRRWPGAIGYLPQDIVLANASVRFNVALGLPDGVVDDDDVWESLERAGLAQVIRSEEAGLSTPIGERGMRLSGGQRQRLGIARALYTRPKMLVLDEATSALDAETEVAISEAFEELHGDVTVVIIAHRLSTVRSADQVVYLDGGSIVASGSFNDVRSQVPSFDRQANLMGLIG